MAVLSRLVASLLPLSVALGNVIQQRTVEAVDPDNNKLGAIASESAECTTIGIDTIKAGGNAVDAMIATVFCVGTIGMYHSGIGGGGFALVRSAAGKYEFVDFRESAPAAAFTDMYNNDVNLSLYGGLASGVPGELRGLEYLHQNYASLNWSTLIAPAINQARNGFVVSQDLVNYINSATSNSPNTSFLVTDPSWAQDFAPNGTLVKLGDTIYRKRYANTLQSISDQGADAFYTGAIANATIAAIQATNGTMTLDDLANYTALTRTPATINYRDEYKITACSAPSGGEVALAIMKIVQGYPRLGWPQFLNISTHHIDEAMRFAYGMRTNLGDPAFVPGLQTYIDEMLSGDVAREVRNKITAKSHDVPYYDPSGIESLETPGTSHIVTADASGMAVSLTTTINLLFGSQVMVPETGVILNDEMNDFSIPGSTNAFGYAPSVANYIKPFKRPLSSMSPTIVEFLHNSTFYFATGAAGGSRIITATMQNLWHVLDQNATVYEALAAPRFHDQLSPNVVTFEYAFDNQTVAFMESRNHTVAWVAPGASTAQGLRRLSNGTFEAAGEPRQDNSLGAVA